MTVVEQDFLDLSTHGYSPAGPTNKLNLIQQAKTLIEILYLVFIYTYYIVQLWFYLLIKSTSQL